MIKYATKITALYSRLSVGDEDRDGGESNSIVNQKAFLERYAIQHKLMNIRHYIDDDESGRFFDRSAYTQMISDVEGGTRENRGFLNHRKSFFVQVKKKELNDRKGKKQIPKKYS